jgi:hypothetical protein
MYALLATTLLFNSFVEYIFWSNDFDETAREKRNRENEICSTPNDCIFIDWMGKQQL